MQISYKVARFAPHLYTKAKDSSLQILGRGPFHIPKLSKLSASLIAEPFRHPHDTICQNSRLLNIKHHETKI